MRRPKHGGSVQIPSCGTPASALGYPDKWAVCLLSVLCVCMCETRDGDALQVRHYRCGTTGVALQVRHYRCGTRCLSLPALLRKASGSNPPMTTGRLWYLRDVVSFSSFPNKHVHGTTSTDDVV